MAEEIQDLANAMPFQGVIPVEVRDGEDAAGRMRDAQRQHSYMFYKEVLATTGSAVVRTFGAALPCMLQSIQITLPVNDAPANIISRLRFYTATKAGRAGRRPYKGAALSWFEYV